MGDKQSAVAEKNSSNGSDSAPSWLKDLGVKSGEWYISAKARPKRLMKTALSTEAGQIQHCLELHTMPYQSELAVKMLKGKVVPLTPADICEETGYSKQHVRRGLKELEEHGVARRRPINGRGLAELQQDRTEKPVDEKDLTKANVAIYSWAVPRKDTVENGSRARLPFWDSLEPEFAPLEAFASRWKIIPEDNIVVARESLSEAMVAVAEAEEAQKVAVAIVKGILAPSRIYKVERNGKELESNTPPPQPFVNGSSGRAATMEEEEPASLKPPEPTPPDLELGSESETAKPPQKAKDPYAEFKSAYPPGHFDEAKAKPLFKALPKPTQQRVLNRLRNPYLACERWKDQDGRWIPLASTFLKERQYDADPPPRLNGPQSSNGSDERVLKLMRGEV